MVWPVLGAIGGALLSQSSAKPKPQPQQNVPWYQNPQFWGAGLNAAVNVYSARSSNKTAIKLANTAHQRETRDLEKAGLNRILGYSKGSGGAAVPPIQQMFPSHDLNLFLLLLL